MADRVIDISEFQPKSIDWEKVKKTGYRVILRLGLRGSIKDRKIRYDNNFKSYLDGVIKAGIPYSAYFFPTPMSDQDADEEAEWVIKQVAGLSLDMPLYLDSERVPGGCANDITTAQRTRFLKRITDRLVAAGIPCGIYASTSWLQHQINMGDLQQQVLDNTWVAQYATKCTYDGVYVMWQFTSKGKVDGISGNIDMSVITGKFNMSCKKKETKFVHSRSAIVSEAISHIGVKEGSVLHHKIIDRYNSRKPLPRGYAVKYTDAWCATFVSYLAIIMGYTDIIPVECGCPQMIAKAKEMGIWVEDDSYVPKPGDSVLYDWQDSGKGDNTGTADHIGLVETVVDGMITVIEGNLKDAVGRRQIAVNGRYIRGYIVPKYDEESSSASPKPAEEPATDYAHTVDYYAIVNTKTDPLNIRTGAGTQYKTCSFSPLPKGTKVGVCKYKVGKWYLIKYEGRYGFAHSMYLLKV